MKLLGRCNARSTKSMVGGGLALVLLSTLAGCGAASGAGPENPTVRRTQYTAAERASHNDIDVDFAQMMLVHTRQSMDLVTMALERSDDAEVLALAEQLAAQDTGTVGAMTGLLESWGADIPDEIALAEMDHSQMDHAGIGMGFAAGITDVQVTLLGSLSDETFDKKFLKFIFIHRGAGVAMAQSEKIYGQSGAATKIAKDMETDQGAEMQTIEDLIQPS